MSGSRRTSPRSGRNCRPWASASASSRSRGYAALELRLDDIHKPRFVLNEQSIVRDAKLIVLDEVSMVGAEMAHDLLAFGKPILVLGDPGQLPPIKGDGAFTSDDPDVMLTEIHRQAGESAIIRLATLARQASRSPTASTTPSSGRCAATRLARSRCCAAAKSSAGATPRASSSIWR